MSAPPPGKPADPLSILSAALEARGDARLFVAAFTMDFRLLVTLAIAALPAGMQSDRLRALPESEDLPTGRATRLYGLLTGFGPTPPRFRLVLPFKLPEAFRLLLEDASLRAEDDPVRSYWIPIAAIARGSITVVDSESVKLEHPLVVFRIEKGAIRVAGAG